MKKIIYFFAAIYQKLYDKKPDGIPYFSFKTCIFLAFFLPYNSLGFFLKSHFGIEFYPSQKGTAFFIYFLVFITMYILLGVIFPLDRLRDIEVPNNIKNRSYYILVSYLYLNLALVLFTASMLNKT